MKSSSLILSIVLFFLLSHISRNNLYGQIDSSAPAVVYESPSILSQWYGGSLSNNETNINFQNTLLYYNKFNFSLKNNFEFTFNLHDNNCSGILKYRLKPNDRISLSPSVLIAEGLNVVQTGPSSYESNTVITASPGITINYTASNKQSGISIAYFKLLSNNNLRTTKLMLDIDARDYILGLNFYFFPSPKWLVNLEILTTKNAMLSRSEESSSESHMNFTLSYSKNSIVGYDFGFWTQLSNKDDYCDLFCLYFLPTFGINLDLTKIFKVGSKSKN